MDGLQHLDTIWHEKCSLPNFSRRSHQLAAALGKTTDLESLWNAGFNRVPFVLHTLNQYLHHIWEWTYTKSVYNIYKYIQKSLYLVFLIFGTNFLQKILAESHWVSYLRNKKYLIQAVNADHPVFWSPCGALSHLGRIEKYEEISFSLSQRTMKKKFKLYFSY